MEGEQPVGLLDDQVGEGFWTHSPTQSHPLGTVWHKIRKDTELGQPKDSIEEK